MVKERERLPQEEAPAKKLRLTKPSKSAALHIDLCKASNPTDALQYLLHFARSSVEAESVEGVVRILLEHYYKEQDNSVRLKIASLIGLLSKTQNFNPETILDDTLNTFNTEKSHQILAQLLDTLLVIGTQLPESPTVRHRLIEVACKHLSDTYFGVRNKCLQLLGCLCNVDTPLNKDGQGLVPAVIGGGAPGVSGGVCVRDAQSVISDYFADQDPRVRTAAIKAMLQLHERGLKIQQTIYDQQVRLVDDSFGKISHMVSDGSWVVRVQAAKTLGNMLQVSPHFLEQTLDKKLMSDLRVRTLCVWRKWADDAPKEKVDTSAVNLIASGACGAFVHGLEDEMYEVRIAAVDALSALAQSSASFAEKCLDFLVDMFNDEIEEVRLQSIHCIQLALLELLKNLTKYPTDRNSVWKCLKFLGCRHPTLVLPLVPELLSTHPYFHTPEPDMDDPAYIAVLVLVFNAAQSCPTMTALFSDHTFRHYTYLRDSLSHLVPPLRSLSRISTIHNLQDPGAQDLLNFTIRDLQRLGELQTELAGAADFSATYLRCQLLLTKALQEKLWTMAVPLCLKDNAMATAAAKQMLEETYKLEFLYSGLENRQVATIHHVRLQAKALQLVLTARTRRGVEPLISVCEKFLQEVESFQRLFVVELPHLQESFVGKLLDVSPRLSACKPGELVKILQTTLRQSGFLNLQLPKQVQRASATIIEPTGESDNPLRFTSGLVVALDIDATLEHVQDPHNTVKVQVLYPDGQSHVIQPKPGDFRSPGPHRHRLITQVYLSHSAWTEACQIEVRLLLAYSSSRLCKAAWSDSSTESLQPAEGATEGTIPFGKPVKVFIMPKPARR
ncbi:unnamed protein product [Coregonus sp. 'balchen']|nr:unnamed protein product [Coregonus sp. 'balchen']